MGESSMDPLAFLGFLNFSPRARQDDHIKRGRMPAQRGGQRSADKPESDDGNSCFFHVTAPGPPLGKGVEVPSSAWQTDRALRTEVRHSTPLPDWDGLR